MTFTRQSALVRASYRVTTIYWGQLPAICKDFSQWIERTGFGGKLIVIESVERLLAEHLDQSEACGAMSKKPLVVKKEALMPPLLQLPGSDSTPTPS
jgi:hypothetical protein